MTLCHIPTRWGQVNKNLTSELTTRARLNTLRVRVEKTIENLSGFIIGGHRFNIRYADYSVDARQRKELQEILDRLKEIIIHQL